MTVIAAAGDKKGYWIGSDSHGVSAGLSFELGTKLIKKGDYVIGFVDSYRVRDIIQEHADFPPTIRNLKDLGIFRDRLKELLIDDGCTSSGSSGETIMHPIGLIIISPNGIYSIDVDYQIHKVKKYAANGSGMYVALGALHSVMAMTGDAEEAVRRAVAAAIYHSTACGGKTHIEHVPASKRKKRKK